MTFVKLFGDYGYYHWDKEQMRLYNFRGGWRTIDENSEGWGKATTIEAESWHRLYLITGYCPLMVDLYARDAWMDTDGNLYEGDGHSYWAERISEFLFGYNSEYDIYDPADELVEVYGWVKITTSLMLPYYISSGMYDNLNYEQRDTLRKWAIIHDKIDLFTAEGLL